MPLLMKTRNESVVYHEGVYDISKSRKWLRDFNRAGSHQSATMFHLFLWACALGIQMRPSMNRFVSGGRIYKRKKCEISFAAKKTFSRDEPLVTVKLLAPSPSEPLVKTTERIVQGIDEARSKHERAIDKEIRWAAFFPVFLVKLALWFLALLDRWNLLPKSFIERDPMYASLFITNLGSVGMDRAYHHLYEYGTVSIFAVMGQQKKMQFIDARGQASIRDGMSAYYTLDERVADGFLSGTALNFVREVMEDPEKYFGAPEQAAQGGQVQTLSEAA